VSLLQATGLEKSFGGIRALDACSIAVEKGSITGLIGPNGSGKTTLFNVITGYERPDVGTVEFNGLPITNCTPDKVFSLGIGRTFQLTRIFPRLTVMENMHVAAQRKGLVSLLRRWSHSDEAGPRSGATGVVGISHLANTHWYAVIWSAQTTGIRVHSHWQSHRSSCWMSQLEV